MKYIAIALLTLFVSGCARNPYTLYYEGQQNARLLPAYTASNEPLQIYSTSNFEEDTAILIRKGYAPFGKSSFNGSSGIATKKQLIKHAEMIGAQVVLVNIDYSHTIQGTAVKSIPQHTQSHYSGTTTLYGSRGQATGVSQGTAYTTSRQAVLVPYSIDRYEFSALFFTKLHSRLGVYVVPVPNEVRSQISTNAGVLVRVVVDESPAAIVDIFPGDIVLSIQSERVNSMRHFGELLNKHGSAEIALQILRDGKIIEKVVSID